MLFDDLNPKFVFFSPVRGKDDLAEHVDHAIIALDARAPLAGDCAIETLRELDQSERALRVELWVSDLDDYTCTYGFLIASEDGRTPFARGERCVVNVDPVSHRAAKWSSEFRVAHTELRKDLPAYA